jgi:flavin-dependent dehydrogenase
MKTHDVDVLRDHRHIEVRGRRAPLGGRAEPLHCGRVLLVGDAAGLVDPFLGEGIAYALTSARLAAPVVQHALGDDRIDLSAYTRAAHARLVRDFVYAERIARLFYAFPRLGYQLFLGSSLVSDGIIDVILGRMSYEALFKRLAANVSRVLVNGFVKGSV